MDGSVSRRVFVQSAAVAAGVALTARTRTDAGPRHKPDGWVVGKLTGARAIAETLKAEGAGCVFGIPGVQENEIWDEFKARGIPYLLVGHEFAASSMADGYARSTGRPGVCCLVPGPGVTNALTGLGEALLDSSPVIAIVGDVANGEKYRPFQVHSLPNVDLLRPVTKCVYAVTDVRQIPAAIRQAFQLSLAGEPGPVAVVVPFNLLIEQADFRCPPLADLALPFDEDAFQRAIALLADKSSRVGIYAGYGCMDFSEQLTAAAELLQAPVATSISGKGCIPESHPLAVGWGYGPHAGEVAETVFAKEKLHPLKTGVDCLLAIGVKFSEVSTGFYGNPKIKRVIHVDANKANLGVVVPADVCVHADAGVFLSRLAACGDAIRRPADPHLFGRIMKAKAEHAAKLAAVPAGKCGVDPLALVAALRCHLPDDAILFTDVTTSEHLATESFRVCRPRTIFNPADNQGMGWSIPAAIGAQQVHHGRVVATLTGDGCFIMAMQELATAARACLPVKFFVLDDHAFHYMQVLQEAAFRRTTATVLPTLDYCALAKGFGVSYVDIAAHGQLATGIQTALATPGPVLVRVQTDYSNRKIRWVEAVRAKFAKELTPAQKARFLARIGTRTVTGAKRTSD